MVVVSGNRARERETEGERDVIPLSERGGEVLEAHGERLDASGVVRVEPRAVGDQVERGALLLPGLGERDGAALEVQQEQVALASGRSAMRSRVEAARDHQMEDEVAVRRETEDDTLAEALGADEAAPLEVGEGRGDAPQEEGAAET